jgi:hypothetical protein
MTFVATPLPRRCNLCFIPASSRSTKSSCRQHVDCLPNNDPIPPLQTDSVLYFPAK